jgi:signal transduction histidine kinase/ActR/RegA family two-component response regulator
MKLRTSLHLSAMFPIVFAGSTVLLTMWSRGSQWRESTFMALLGLLGVVMGAVILSYTRRIFGSITTLNEWIDAVLSGNLEHRVNIPASNDEVGRLSQSLSRMLRELKEAYAGLVKESQQHKHEALLHKKGAEASQMATKHLAEALDRLKQTHVEDIEKKRLDILQQIVRGATHDFSEAMTPILGTCELLLDHPETLADKEKTLQQLRSLQDSAERVKKLLKNLAGFCHAPREMAGPTDPNSVVEEAIGGTKPYWRDGARANGTTIDVRTNLALAPAIAVNGDDLREALVNLIMNAVQAMPYGGVISVSTRSDQQSVSIEVRDTGKGMNEEVRRHCIEPFYSTRDDGSTGTGLTVVNSIARRHGGTLDVASEPDRGTCATLKFPLWMQKMKSEGETDAERKVTAKLRLLVVDDDAASCEIVARALTFDGHRVETAPGGVEGMAKFGGQKFDAAIIDRAMPGMNGDELAEAIKRASPETAVVMLTGFGDIMLEEADIPAHVDAIVPKPATLKDLQRGLVVALTPKPPEPADLEAMQRKARESEGADRSRKGQSFKWIH